MIIFKHTLTIALILLGVSHSKLNGEVITGNASLKRELYESLTVAGALDFNQLKIEKDLTVSGSAKGKFLKCEKFVVSGTFTGESIQAKSGEVSGSLECSKLTVAEDLAVSGSLTGEEIKISGKTSISGNLDASKSEFADIEIASATGTLLDSTAQNILVKKTNDESQKMHLKGKSTIKGDIIFESGNGKVIIGAESKVIGKIQGASIVKE